MITLEEGVPFRESLCARTYDYYWIALTWTSP
jgi:hypothetical protein